MTRGSVHTIRQSANHNAAETLRKSFKNPGAKRYELIIVFNGIMSDHIIAKYNSVLAYSGMLMIHYILHGHSGTFAPDKMKSEEREKLFGSPDKVSDKFEEMLHRGEGVAAEYIIDIMKKYKASWGDHEDILKVLDSRYQYS